jgi:hypothetical protein
MERLLVTWEGIDRAYAKRLGFKIYPSKTTCPRGSIFIRRVSDGNCLCKKCCEIRNKTTEVQNEWRRQHKDRVAKHKRKWNENNADAIKLKNRNYRKNNKAAVLSSTRARQLKKKMATPAWAELDKIKQVYLEAARLTEQTGIKHHVDHIIPISSLVVCGLHVHGNLQIITAEENVKKGCKFEDGGN